MVLAELSGGAALLLEHRRDRDDLLRHADRRAWNPDLGEARAVTALTGDEGRAARRARLLAVGVGEHHAFPRQLVDVRRLIAHHAVRVAAEIRDADIVAPDHQDVRLLAVSCGLRGHGLRHALGSSPIAPAPWPRHS